MSALLIVFTICLADGRCERLEMPWHASAQSCALYGQQVIARYLQDRPGYRLSGGYRCTEARDA